MKQVFQLKDMVFYKGSSELHGYVTGVLQAPGGYEYRVGWSDGTEGWHFDFELTTEKTFGP